MLTYIRADLTLETQGLIVHSVNAQGVMGSGIAKAIRDKWPEVYEAYRTHVQGKAAMGKVQFVNIADNFYVANLWGQEFFGNDGAVYADKAAIKRGLITAFEFCEDYNLELKMPMIGALRGGLDWDSEVVPIINQVMMIHPDVVVKIIDINVPL